MLILSNYGLQYTDQVILLAILNDIEIIYYLKSWRKGFLNLLRLHGQDFGQSLFFCFIIYNA